MPNNISTLQRSEHFVELLAASTQVYRTLSHISTLRLVIAALPALVGFIQYLNGSSSPFSKAIAALFAIVVLIIDIGLMEPWYKSLKRKGTDIQEVFDTELFDLPWNRFKCGEKLKKADISPWILRYKITDASLSQVDKEWYPAQRTDPIELEFARLICQRSNLRWDGDLRTTYSITVLGIIVFWVVLTIGYGAWSGIDINRFLVSFIVPSLPILKQLADIVSNQFEWSTKATKLQNQLDSVWQTNIGFQNLDLSELRIQSRQIQDEIYDRRLNAKAVPSFFNKLSHNSFESYMRDCAEGDVKQVLERKTIGGIDQSG